MTPLPCGHPDGCKRFHPNTEEAYCAWCAQVDELLRDNAALRGQLESKAVIVQGGEAKFSGPVGYLVVHSGATAVFGEQPPRDIARTLRGGL